MGDTLDFNKVSNIQTAGAKISETVKMPESKFLIKRGSMVVDEYGNSVPYTGKLESLSQFSPTNPIHKALKDDQVKVLDIEAAKEFKKTTIKYVPTGPTTGTWENAAVTATTALANFSVFHLKEIVDGMKRGQFGASFTGRPVPYYEDGTYVALASITALRSIKDDPEWEEWHKYTDPEGRYSNEMGKFYGVRFIENNHEAALDASVGSGGVLGEVLICGEDAVVEGIVTPEEVRAKVPDDYGRSKGVAWYFLGGWKLIWDFDVDGEQRIVYVTSA